MFHIVLYSSSIASGATSFAQVTGVYADEPIPRLNSGFQVPVQLPYIGAVFGVGAHLCDIRPQAPSFLPLPYPTFNPGNRGAVFESPPRIFDFFSNPIPLRPTEELDIFATQNSGSSETEYVAVIFTDGQQTPAATPTKTPALNGNGRFFTAHATSATTLTASAWTLCSLTFDYALPAGYYALIGARAYSAGALFFRILPATAPYFRPGGLAVQAYDQLDAQGQRAFSPYHRGYDGWGEWVRFWQNVPPQIEMFSTSADTAEEFWLDLVKLSEQVTSGAP